MPARDDVPALQRTAETAERLLFVVVSRIRPEPAMGALQHLQWFDYRRQEPGELEALATWLAVPGAKLREVVWKYKPLSDVSVPAAVSGAVGLLTIVSVIFLSVIAWTVGELAFSGEEEFGSWQQMVFPPIAGLVMAITAGGLRYRALSFRQLLGLLACVCVLIIAAEPGLGAIVAAIVAGFAAGLVHLRTWSSGGTWTGGARAAWRWSPRREGSCAGPPPCSSSPPSSPCRCHARSGLIRSRRACARPTMTAGLATLPLRQRSWPRSALPALTRSCSS
jgi:hypothetical protein